jgi:hypothetical protein
MCASADDDLASFIDSRHVVARAKDRLQMAPCPPLGFVSCEFDDGVLILHGQVPSFFQAAVLHVEGVAQVEVVESSNNGG